MTIIRFSLRVAAAAAQANGSALKASRTLLAVHHSLGENTTGTAAMSSDWRKGYAGVSALGGKSVGGANWEDQRQPQIVRTNVRHTTTLLCSPVKVVLCELGSQARGTNSGSNLYNSLFQFTILISESRRTIDLGDSIRDQFHLITNHDN